MSGKLELKVDRPLHTFALLTTLTLSLHSLQKRVQISTIDRSRAMYSTYLVAMGIDLLN